MQRLATVPGMRTVVSGLSTVATAAADVVWPPTCSLCGERGAWACRTCTAALPLARQPACPRCGARVCECARMPDGLQVIRSVGPHAGWLQRSIHAMKYDGERVRARHLGALMRPWLVELLAAEPTALVVPVPLHVDRLRGRGFNQSLLVARHAVHSDPWPIASAAVARVRSTRQQVHLSLSERERNVSGAFEADPLVVANRPILLVDDVFTTGSTLMACAAALRDAGATDIAAVTLSRAHWTASTWA